ncbi:MAG: hypothetical protein IJ229_11395 [Clostridia bacterium]|nr:hypothetical protein [Clostridia bacterium]
MVEKGLLPVKKIALLCNPGVIMFLGHGLNLIADGAGSGAESLGWLLMVAVCAFALTGGKKGEV